MRLAGLVLSVPPVPFVPNLSSTFAKLTFVSPYFASCGVGNGLPSVECGSVSMSKSASGSSSIFAKNLDFPLIDGVHLGHSSAATSVSSFFTPALSPSSQRQLASSQRASARRRRSSLSPAATAISNSGFASFQRHTVARVLPRSECAAGLFGSSSIQRRLAARFRSRIASCSSLEHWSMYHAL